MDKLSDILSLNSTKIKNSDEFVLEKLNKHLASFKFDEDYLLNSGVKIIESNNIKYYSCRLSNFIENRFIGSDFVPNRSSFPIGLKNRNEYEQWSYNLTYNKLFTSSTSSLIIEESHHAKSCPTCNQNGKLRCSSCSGAGQIRCFSCDGRGEKRCDNCYGKGEKSCMWCSGKGRIEEGYGADKRTRNCNSCNGRGYNPCSSCRSGYITCNSCTGSGKLTCITCHGSGEVTCYTCDGYRTLDNYFIVNAEYSNKVDEFNLTNPYHGFDKSKATENNFDLYKVVYKQIENKYDKNILQEISKISEYNRILNFLNFIDSNSEHLIKSQIEILENGYNEVTYEFYGEIYYIIFDKDFNKYYYPNRKPSDQYEFDMIKSGINHLIKNDLEKAKSTIEKIAKFSFINISEKELTVDIDNTIKIYQADDDYQIRKYSHAEDMIKSVSANKKLDKDYLDIKNKLTFIYDLNTLKFSLICFSAICLMLLNKNSQFILPNLGISACIIFICLLINRLARNINIARWLVVVFFSIQLGYAAYISIIQSNEIRAEYLKDAEFDNFKKDKIIISIDNNDESLFSYIDFPRGVSGQAILLDEQQNVDNPYYSFVVKPGFIEEWYSSEVKIPNFLVTEQRRVYSDENLIEIISGISDPNYKIILRDWEKRLQFYARVSDLYVIELVAVAFLFNDKESFEKNQTYIVHMPKFIYELLKQKKAINKYNFSNAPSISILESGIFKNLNNSLTIGQSYQGGIIVKIDESGQHGYVMSIEDLGMSNWYKANDLCNNYSYDSFDDWSLPNIEELREIYGLKNQVSNFQENWYWSSTEDQSDSDLAFHLGFISGDEMSVKKDHGKYVRAIRKF